MRNIYIALTVVIQLFFLSTLMAVDCTGYSPWSSGSQSAAAFRTYNGSLYQNQLTGANGWDGAGDDPETNPHGHWTLIGVCGNEPTVNTNAASSVCAYIATLNGTITSNSGFAIIDRGFIYGTSSAAVDAATVSSPGSATVVSEGGTTVAAYNDGITGLSNNTTYYFKAYATNSDGTGYGSRLSFSTSSCLPTLSTNAASGISNNGATLNGNVTSNGGFSLTDRGFIYHTSSATVDAATVGSPGSATVESEGGTAVSSFSEAMTGLCRNSTYYFKAYATNSDGSGYGTRRTFTTSNTNSITTTTSGAWTNTATWGGCTAASTSSTRANDNIDIAHNVTVNSLSVSNGNTITVKAGATLTISGALNIGYTGNVVVEAGGTLIVGTNLSFSSNLNSLVSAGTVDIGGDVSFSAGSSITSTGDMNIDGDIDVSNNADVALGGVTTIGGSVTNVGAGSTFDFDGTSLDITGNYSISANATSTFEGDISVGGNITATGSGVDMDVLSGSLDVGGSMTLDGDAVYTFNADVEIAGNLNVEGSATASVGLGATVNIAATMNVRSDAVVSGQGVITWNASNVNPDCSPARVVCNDGTQLDNLAYPEPCPDTAAKIDLFPKGIELLTCSNPLPVEFLTFNGRYEEHGVILNWSTSTEKNNNYFTVLRSEDGEMWEEIGTVNGAGNSFEVINYDFVDGNHLLSGAYYKIKQTDFDGNYDFSSAIYVKTDISDQVTVSPNPTEGKFSVRFGNGVHIQNYTITTVKGQLLIQESVDHITAMELDLSNHPKGVYVLTVIGDDNIVIKKVTKN